MCLSLFTCHIMTVYVYIQNVLISGLKLTSPANVGQKKWVSILKGEYVFNFNPKVKT